jgi:hypothetical protein
MPRATFASAYPQAEVVTEPEHYRTLPRYPQPVSKSPSDRNVMETRQVIAWGIILFLIVMVGAAIRFGATSKKRQRARERRAFDRRAAALTAEEKR